MCYEFINDLRLQLETERSEEAIQTQINNDVGDFDELVPIQTRFCS